MGTLLIKEKEPHISANKTTHVSSKMPTEIEASFYMADIKKKKKSQSYKMKMQKNKANCLLLKFNFKCLFTVTFIV